MLVLIPPDPPVGRAASACLSKELTTKSLGPANKGDGGMNGNGGCRALRVSTGRFWESQPAAVEGSTRGASGSTLTEDQQHVPGARPVHTTETHGDQQHPASVHGFPRKITGVG